MTRSWFNGVACVCAIIAVVIQAHFHNYALAILFGALGVVCFVQELRS